MLSYPALIGGLLIGLSATLLLLANGRIAGISGIVWGAVSSGVSNLWRWLFLAGLVLGNAAYHLISGEAAPSPPNTSLILTSFAGLAVGFGVQLGSGCTSGHGVCGLGRLSPRSLAATLTFMACGIATVFLTRHVLEIAA